MLSSPILGGSVQTPETDCGLVDPTVTEVLGPFYQMYKEIGESNMPRVLTNEQNNQRDVEKQHLSFVNFLIYFFFNGAGLQEQWAWAIQMRMWVLRRQGIFNFH